MNYTYYNGEPFLEVTFPTRGVKVALFRYEDIKRIMEKKNDDGKPVVILNIKDSKTNNVSEWYFDGTMEEFKENCKRVYL